MKTIKQHPSYLYAKSVVNGTLKNVYGQPTTAPVYVIKQCEQFLEVADGKSDKYKISMLKVNQLDGILKLLRMPKGLKAGQSMFKCETGYQWIFHTAIFCTVHRDNPNRRRYETGILEICRKNFKTYTIAVLFILFMLTEPKFSKFFSVAPDGQLSREVRDAIKETLQSSPFIYEYQGTPRFKILRDYIKFLPTEITYTPLNYTNSRFDGKLPAVFLADEVGALPNSYAIESMRSGQINILNKFGAIISTKYPSFNNPFEDEVEYAKKCLDRIVDDETVFALLYEPDNSKDWVDDNLILEQGNPVALEIPEIWDDLIKKRARAIEIESARENFLTKHCNIIYQGTGTETFIPLDVIRQCKVDSIDWSGQNVYIGVDLSMSNDNCAVAMSFERDGEIYSDIIAFIPEGRIEEKNKIEKINYHSFIKAMKCIACGDMTVDYSVIEQFVFDVESTYGCTVVSIGYDRYNALSSAQKWDERYTTVQIRQHSDTLHPPTKLLYEFALNKKWHYTENKLLEINFENARCTYDTNMNRYVNKKKSSGKVDMVVSLINSLYLLQQDVIFYDGDFVVQAI